MELKLVDEEAFNLCPILHEGLLFSVEGKKGLPIGKVSSVNKPRGMYKPGVLTTQLTHSVLEDATPGSCRLGHPISDDKRWND